jgi:hypothetical protein
MSKRVLHGATRSLMLRAEFVKSPLITERKSILDLSRPLTFVSFVASRFANLEATSVLK